MQKKKCDFLIEQDYNLKKPINNLNRLKYLASKKRYIAVMKLRNTNRMHVKQCDYDILQADEVLEWRGKRIVDAFLYEIEFTGHF